MKHTAEELERTFKGAASLRIARKNRGNENYTDDAGYWDGGKCAWGGSHNLKEDCQKIAKDLNKLDELKKVKEELQKCTSKQDFDATKSRLIRQAGEVESGLQLKTGSSSSMFGICIIWADFPEFTESKLKTLRNEVNRFKREIDGQQYKYYEELKLLKLKQKEIENRMKENKKKAQSEKDPAKKALLLQLIEDDGKSLEENLKKQKEIPASKLSFDPDKYVADLIKGMKDAIEENQLFHPGRGNRNTHNRKTPRNPNHSDDDSDSGDEPDNIKIPNPNTNSKTPSQNNQQLLIFGAIALVVIYFLMNQKENTNEYDY